MITTMLKVLEQFHPKSIFLYGSRRRGDATVDSGTLLVVAQPES